MLKLDTQINLDIAKFLHWWGEELAFLVPEWLQKLLGRKRSSLVLTKAGEGLEAIYTDDAGERHLGDFTLDEAGNGKRERLFAEIPVLNDAEVVLRLLPEQSLRKIVKLPAAAQENLQQVIAFEMDRLTPFKADQVYFGVRVVEKLPETRQIRVELVLTPKQTLDPLLDELVACGWRPDRVDVRSIAAGVGQDLLPEKFRPRKNKLPQVLTAISAAAFGSFLLAVLLLPILADRALIRELEQNVKIVGKTAKEVEALRDDVQKLERESGFLAERKRTEPAMVDMLNELSRVIPDQTSLYGLQYRDRKVVIQGRSPAASSLIELVEASPFFKNTSFVSPVIKDIASGQERFQIASEVFNGRSSENPTE
jgi:general secretion pathway protein L